MNPNAIGIAGLRSVPFAFAATSTILDRDESQDFPLSPSDAVLSFPLFVCSQRAVELQHVVNVIFGNQMVCLKRPLICVKVLDAGLRMND